MNPTVTFVVPCYKLGHLLAECVNSILCQTYTDLEVLIMDDCSPDETPRVAQSFHDPRVKHVRNDPNLGHLRNYNKGIGLANGTYVWLISADDRLRRDYVLERYVHLMESHANVGYVFCPAVRLENGTEGETLEYSVHGHQDAIFDGRTFLCDLVNANTIVAPTGMVRKSCYDEIAYFPLDMPWGGDWYLWCVFALHFDVGYFADPMVCYRRHSLSMTNLLTTASVQTCASEDVAMPWIIKRQAEAAGYDTLSSRCLLAAANEYTRSIVSKQYKTADSYTTSRMGLEEFEESLQRQTSNTGDQNWVRARVYAGMGEWYRQQGEISAAREFYYRGLRMDSRMLRAWLEWILLVPGNCGIKLRESLLALRRVLKGQGRVRASNVS